MTRLLIVDDDHGQLRLLARVISMRRRDLTVLTASHGLEAIEVLSSGPVDLVLTDLQMPEMNGFELLAWVLTHQPHVPVYSMTAYPAEADERLSELGSIECFTKPLDIPVLLDRVSRVLADGARGHVRNIGLPSFLQLLEMERKTCTLAIEAGARIGHLYLDGGALIDAQCRDLEGTSAALAILSWPDPAITILNGCASRRRTIEVPTGFLIMDAMRQQDEAARAGASPASEPPELGADFGFDDFREHRRSELRAPTQPPERISLTLSRFPVYLPADARAIALVANTGRVRTAAGSLEGIDAHAEFVARLFSSEAAAVRRLKLDDDIHEMVVTTRNHWTLVRPVPQDPASLVMLVFDPERANLVMERRELQSFVVELEQWCAQQIG